MTCFKGDPFVVIFCAVGAFAGQNISDYISKIIQALVDIPSGGMLGTMLSISLCSSVGFLCYYLFVKRIDYSTIQSKSIIVNSVVILGLTIICSENIPVKNNEASNILYYIYAIISCVLTLYVQYRLFAYDALKSKKQEIEKILYAENKQQKLSKQSIEMLNLRCHDLRHQLDYLMNAESNASTGELIRELKETIDNYDSIVHTGLDVLDTVLTEKNFFCKQNKILFSYILAGEKLSFLQDSEVYSLFGNALDNAIEAVMRVEPEKRIISLSASEKSGFFHIHIENYCNTVLKFQNGLPVTLKTSGLHGYGTFSIRRIAEKYNGTATIVQNGNWVYLDVLLANQQQKETVLSGQVTQSC